MTETIDEAVAALVAWRNWRKTEATLNRAMKDLDNWTAEAGRVAEDALSAELEARRLAWRLLDAASLGQGKVKP